MNDEADKKEDDVILEPDEENADGAIQDKLKSLREKLRACEKEKTEYLTGWQRARADFINFKKEEDDRLARAVQNARAQVVLRILPTLDSLDRALSIVVKESNQSALQTGVENIRAQLIKALTELEVSEISETGVLFNPEIHQAMEAVSVERAKDDGKVLEILEKGYIMSRTTVRPARVRVGKWTDGQK
ncbi:nucleotide exchange factor GrpE [Candidatus Nomurabacteria bacterium RIFCSPLOWO2_02_FULL_42_17]|uniref:Protein GrpE n=1 Tax=Candidatus Nomurabacteria bacterium RIFCSPLOWO2_02_FULL_42_17 TaxID=1801789 RepID=A0A1F6XS40_9BACT|nr:MAG: nucleotide exchange factor GrpE [Candidatus Nomurabacteria bacterium RIFCSPLOWO2_02_FULL_42_17]